MPNLITLEVLYDLVWDLNLSKGKSELLGSFGLLQWNLLSPGAEVSFIVKGLSQGWGTFYSMKAALTIIIKQMAARRLRKKV